jgi:uncharacterized protein YbgA (DUF1722 family)/uncharacterized protein YbbK (DUF523 family)
MAELVDQKKPTIVVSRCLGFYNCRYNGDVLSSDFVELLKPYVNYITACPEVEIGLGVPRNPVRLVNRDGLIELYQPAEDRTYTQEMNQYSERFFNSVGNIHGFILKGRSPSCGIKDVKIYTSTEKSSSSQKGVGIFAAHAITRYPNLPIEEEGRLTNYAIREHFLTKLYTMFRFQTVKQSRSIKELVRFHSEYKFLLMAYHQHQLQQLGKIVANHENLTIDEVLVQYELHLGLAMLKAPSRSNCVNAFMHIFGYFSDTLSEKEKSFLLDRLQKYRAGKVHISAILNVMRAYAIQCNLDYLLNQAIWLPYPEELLDISDSGK